MGIYGLYRYIWLNQLVERLTEMQSDSSFTLVAVDTWNVLRSMFDKQKKQSLNDKNAVIVCIECAISLIKSMLQKKLVPIFVYDYCKYKRDWVNSNSPKAIADKYKVFQKSRKYTASKFSHRVIRRFLCSTGFPYASVPGYEADEVCANLFHTKTVRYVLSLDTDLLAMGCDVMFDVTPMFPVIVTNSSLRRYLGVPDDVSRQEFLELFTSCQTDINSDAKDFKDFIDDLPEYLTKKKPPYVTQSPLAKKYINHVAKLITPMSLEDSKFSILKRVPVVVPTVPNINEIINIMYVSMYSMKKANNFLDFLILNYKAVIKHCTLYQ